MIKVDVVEFEEICRSKGAQERHRERFSGRVQAVYMSECYSADAGRLRLGAASC